MTKSSELSISEKLETQSNHVGKDVTSKEVSDVETVRRQIDPMRYKTRLCRHFFEKGACPFAQTCAFAHGEHELRTLEGNTAMYLASKHVDGMCPSTLAPKYSTCTCLQCQPCANGAPYPQPSLPHQHGTYHQGHYAHHYEQASNYPYASAPHNYNGYMHRYPQMNDMSYSTGYSSMPYTYPPYYQRHQHTNGDQGTQHTYTIDPYATYPNPAIITTAAETETEAAVMTMTGTSVALEYLQAKPSTPTQAVPVMDIHASRHPNAVLP